MSNTVKVAMADYKVSKSPNKLLTFGLGSCVGITLFDKVKKMYPVYSKLMFIYKIQLLFLESNLFRANYAGLCKKV